MCVGMYVHAIACKKERVGFECWVSYDMKLYLVVIFLLA